MNKAIAIAALALACAGWAQAQTVYRCGNGYSQKPCTEGQAMQLEDNKPSRDEADTAAANARRDAQLADTLEKERLAREKAAPKALVLPQAAQVAASAPQTGTKLPKASIKGRKLEQFKATAPAQPGADTSTKKAKKKKSSD